nr:hypothetical protein [Natronosalvus caseinilyticus]
MAEQLRGQTETISQQAQLRALEAHLLATVRTDGVALEVDVPDSDVAIVTPVRTCEPSVGRAFDSGDASADFTESMTPILECSGSSTTSPL